MAQRFKVQDHIGPRVTVGNLQLDGGSNRMKVPVKSLTTVFYAT